MEFIMDIIDGTMVALLLTVLMRCTRLVIKTLHSNVHSDHEKRAH